MMAEPSDFTPPDDVLISVIDSKFTASYVVDLIFVTNSRGDHTITDGQSGVLFTVNPFGATFHDQLVLRDVNDEIIVTLRKKIAGCSSNRSFSIYTRDSSRKIAKTHEMHDKDKFLVKVGPNVDYAFVSTLIAVIEAMKTSHFSGI
nr:hypothetical protein [Tanacetum cinerariifolium]